YWTGPAFTGATGRGKPPSEAGDPPPGAAARHSKKNLGYHLNTERRRFERIKAMSADYSLSLLCDVLAVSRSGYHAWASRLPGPRAQADAALLPLITQAHGESRQTYGSPRIVHWLRQHGYRCGRSRVARLMRHIGLSHWQRRRFRPL